MRKLILALSIFISTNAYANTITLGTISADSTPGGFNDSFTLIANVINGVIEGSTDSGASVSNIKADSVFRINMADDADPATFAKETLSITVDTVASDGALVYSGCIPADDTDLTSDISACVAYVNGIRVSKAATAQTYTASRDCWLDISQTGVYTSTCVANGAAEPVVAANSARVSKVVTNGTEITTITDQANRRLPGLLIPAHYRAGLVVSRDSATTLTIFPGTCEINNTMVNKTSTTTLTVGTAGDWAGGTSLLAASTMGFVGVDASGNLKMHTTAPTHDNYGVSTTAGKKRYATWSSTVYRILGWFYMNPASQVYSAETGNIREFDVANTVVTSDQSVFAFSSTSYSPVSLVNFYSSGGPITLISKVSGDGVTGFAFGETIMDMDTVNLAGSDAGMPAGNVEAMTITSPFQHTPSQAAHTYRNKLKVNQNSIALGNRTLVVREE